MSVIYNAFGAVLSFIYGFVHNYGVALILFTLLVKVLLFPLGIKQQKSTIKQIKIRPKEELIRKKYSYDKNLQNQKVMELYQKEGFNPMGGCLPLIVQLPIIIVLWHVIQNADKYIGANVNNIFLGLNLKTIPSFALKYNDTFNWYLLLPIISALTAYLQGKISQEATKYTSAAANQQAGAGKAMILMSPILSLWISFSLPTGVGVYWITSNVLGILQTVILNKMYSPKKASEEAMDSLRAEVAKRKARKEAAAAEKARQIEQAKLDKKNAARKAAGLKPLDSLDAKDDQIDTTEESDND